MRLQTIYLGKVGVKIMMPNFTGMLFCYRTKKEMDEVYTRLNDLKITTVMKAWNHEKPKPPYPWTVAIICNDKAQLELVDTKLVDSGIDLGTADIYVGEARILEFFKMLVIVGKYEPGIVRIEAGECPLNGKSAISCQFCPVGHMLECHHPMTCDQAKCSHLAKYME